MKIAIVSLMLALLLASNLRAEDKIEAVEQEITKQFDICEKAAPDHVADCFYKVADKMRPYLATLYDQKLKEYGKHGDWKFEEPLVQELYDNARGANLFCGQRSVEFELRNEKDFVNHIIYAAADKLLRQLSDKLYHDEATSYVRIETLDLHLKGNEKSIHIVQDKETGVVSVTYERDPKQAEQEESVVKVDFGVAMVPRGAKPYFMLPKDADVVSCYVQQTGGSYVFVDDSESISLLRFFRGGEARWFDRRFLLLAGWAGNGADLREAASASGCLPFHQGVFFCKRLALVFSESAITGTVFTLPHNTTVYLYKQAIQWTVIGFKPVGLKCTVDSAEFPRLWRALLLLPIGSEGVFSGWPSCACCVGGGVRG
jgi:hypothetical protein